jgi:3-oxoacyl-[acyl-carrier-protein] synthase-3
MSDQPRIALLGVGHAVGAGVRTNDDPVFEWLKKHPQPDQDLFAGYKFRRVLPCEGTLTDLPTTVAGLMTVACRNALQQASLPPADVDALLGYATVSEYITPNALALVHEGVGLRRDAWLLPVEGEEHFLSALFLANALVQAGSARNALVVTGCNWTRYVNYHTAQSVAVSDGAGAAVVGRTADSSRFAVVDAATTVVPGGYGSMYMQGDPLAVGSHAGAVYTRPYFHIGETGDAAYRDFGRKAPPELANLVLKRHRLTGADVTLISHQSSRGLMTAWGDAIRPGQYLDSLEEFADMVPATVAVNLSYFYDRIEKDNVLLLDVSAELKTTAVLLRRQG